MLTTYFRLFVFSQLILGDLLLFAQSPTGAISGVIKDESGTVLQGVTLTITHQDTGATRNVVTDSRGRYEVANLPLGDYQLAASREGFQVKRGRSGLRVGREKAVVDLTLETATGTSQRLMPDPPAEETHFDRWLKKLEIPVIEGVAVEDTRAISVKPWKETGGLAAYFRLAGTQFLEVIVHEIPPGKGLNAHQHFYEETIYILEGKGHTVIQQQGRRSQRIDWGRDTAFSIPLNVHHQHVNDDPGKPARLLALTNFPFTINTFANSEFIGNVEYAFRERYNAEEEFTRLNRNEGGRQQTMNVIRNVKEAALHQYESRGAGATAMNVSLGGNEVLGGVGISEIPPGRYHRAHAHLNEAFIYIIEGEGYSLIWENNFKKRIKVDWKEGSLVGVPKFWYHQHFNAGEKPARFVRWTNFGYLSQLGSNFTSGDMPYEEEDPEVEELFRRSAKVIDPVMQEIWKKKKAKLNPE